MNKRILLLIFAATLSIFTTAQVSITNIATPYTQDFNTLANTGTSATLPTGWLLSETGTGANTTYLADNGAGNSGNTFSYGSTGNTERAFGSLQSGSVVPTIGVSFTNNSGANITAITVAYTGEQWRAGLASRAVADTLNFQYSLTATSLTTGTWIDENNLDFASPTLSVPAGALDGNAAANRTAKSFTINGLNIANGATFYFRWADFNIASSDDGLSVDDMTISFNGTVIPPCGEPQAQPTNLVLTPTPTTISGSFTAAVPGVDEYLVIRSTAATLSATPSDGVTYSVGQALGGGTIIALSPATTFTDINLTPSITYYYYIFSDSSDGCSGGPNYLITAPLTANAATLPLPACIAPTGAPTNLMLTPGNTFISGSFTAVAGANRYLVVRSSASTLSAGPVNTTFYTAGQALGGGTVVSYGTGTTFSASGLTPATQYYFFVFAANGDCSGEPVYFSTSLDGNATTTNSSGGIPPGYYNTTAGLNCGPLKTALFNIIKPLSANPNPTYDGICIMYPTTDFHKSDDGLRDIIWDMYSDNPAGAEPYEFEYCIDVDGCTGNCNPSPNPNNPPIPGTAEGLLYNREHSFPRSWFGGTVEPMNSDAMHIFPTDKEVNNRRQSFPFGETTTPTWTSLNGSKLGNCTYPGYSGVVFEPIDTYKGDFARAQFYMATCYESNVAGWEPNAAFILNGTAYPAFDNWYIQLLYKWHLQDPVSPKEIDRNNAIYAIQGNRNPFVDRPEFAFEVWSCSGVIPVTLVDFKATQSNSSIVLQWLSAQENNLKQYEILRSTDGANFTSIGITAARNAGNYSFTDNSFPAAKTVFYKLKLVDIDGTFSYSKTVAVRLNGFSGAYIYPNPTNGKLTVQLQKQLTETGTLTICDMTGRMMKQYAVAAQQATIHLDATVLPAGRYFIKITNKNTVINQSFNVVR
jgi:endonuclease I